MMPFHFNLNQTRKSVDPEVLWDTIIIGSGPAGLNAAIYAKRKGLQVGLLAGEPGGQLNNTKIVDNYLGFSSIGGEALGVKFSEHATSLGIPMMYHTYVTQITKEGDVFHIVLEDGTIYRSYTVLLSTGGSPRKLQVKGEDTFQSKGVSYCAICDGPFFKGLDVFVAGGGNNAVETAIDLAAWANTVTMIQLAPYMTADQILLDQLPNYPNIRILLHTEIQEITGSNTMEAIHIFDHTTKETAVLHGEGLFVTIGNVPNSSLVAQFDVLNQRKEVVVNQDQQTKILGLYAAGDVTEQPHRQIIIAAAEGAKAALAMSQYIQTMKHKGE